MASLVFSSWEAQSEGDRKWYAPHWEICSRLRCMRRSCSRLIEMERTSSSSSCALTVCLCGRQSVLAGRSDSRREVFVPTFHALSQATLTITPCFLVRRYLFAKPSPHQTRTRPSTPILLRTTCFRSRDKTPSQDRTASHDVGPGSELEPNRLILVSGALVGEIADFAGEKDTFDPCAFSVKCR